MIVLDASAVAALLLPDEKSEIRHQLYSALSFAIEEGAALLTTDGPLYRVAHKLGVSA